MSSAATWTSSSGTTASGANVPRSASTSAARHLEREGPVEAAGEDLAAHRVPHVVRDQRGFGHADVAHERLDQVRLLEQRVVLIRLLAEAEPEQVGQHDPVATRQTVEDALPVAR